MSTSLAEKVSQGTRLGKRALEGRASPKATRRQDIEIFQSSHPLARLFKGIVFLGWAREDKAWQDIPQYADIIASGWCDLNQETQEALKDCFPGVAGVPCYGERSAGAWVAYLCSLWAVRQMRERLREAVRGAIVGGWGEEWVPELHRSLNSYNYEEPPF